jgi:hypothetical protein
MAGRPQTYTLRSAFGDVGDQPVQAARAERRSAALAGSAGEQVQPSAP